MLRSSYAVAVLLYVAALGVPLLFGLVCGSGMARAPIVAARADHGNCLLAICGSGPGVICPRVF